MQSTPFPQPAAQASPALRAHSWVRDFAFAEFRLGFPGRLLAPAFSPVANCRPLAFRKKLVCESFRKTKHFFSPGAVGVAVRGTWSGPSTVTVTPKLLRQPPFPRKVTEDVQVSLYKIQPWRMRASIPLPLTC